ncbi:cysteine desulfurase [Mesorhizobium sp. WSM3879]|uniref:cysteine desulfurase family protein n=1 Tax=Mesorhizobium sp. WSM3879 TaxID=2029406 RepID=UPI000BB0C3D6|nr:cysteine desulfurase family protein [Mesorhizobium sp. WSM3879]PBB81236.1 cysteine desulfurase [Mesorhizobium sp. WSM3879]
MATHWTLIPVEMNRFEGLCQPPGEAHQWIGSGMAQKAVYLDYQASTPLDPRVRIAVDAAYDAPGNASSEEHAFGWAALSRVEAARGFVAESLNAVAEEVTFTSGATEANNIAILGAAMAAPPRRRRILVSAIEHKSVSAAAYAAERFGFVVEVVPVTHDGLTDIQALEAMLDDEVAIVSVMAVNNEIGTIQPSALVGRLTRSAGAFFHVDATQALAATHVDMTEWGADALSLSGHKIYAPGGIGALIVALDAPWRPKPLMFGGGQEQGLRPGTLPVPLCVGLGEACRLISIEGEVERRRVGDLRDALARRLKDVFAELRVSCEQTPRHPGCLHIRIPKVSASDLLMRLQPLVAASTGSACTSGMLGPSHVVLAIGLSAADAAECLRFSLGRFSTESDVEIAVSCLSSAMRSLSARDFDPTVLGLAAV